MEATALDPPAWLDRLVTLLIPPGAREEVIGDLHEYCATPWQYAQEALRIAPFVIASQTRRNLNLPVLLIQAGLIFLGLGLGATLLTLPLLALLNAYQPLNRPSPSQALRGAVLIAFSGVALLFLVPLVFGRDFQAPPHPGSGLALFILGMPLAPLLCALRACLIIGNDRGMPWQGGSLSVAELATLRQAFLRGARRRNLAEGILIGLAGLCWPMVMDWAPSGIAMAAIHGAAAVFLLTESVPPTPSRSDFVALRALHCRELDRHQQLRRSLWWLWLAPAFLALQLRAATGHLTSMQYSVMAILLCFLVTALNREGRGRVRELTGALERATELTD